MSNRRLTYPRATSGVIGRPTGLQLGTSGTPTTDQNITYDYDTYGRFNTYEVRNSGGTVLQSFTYGYATDSNLIGTVSNSGLNYTDTRIYDSRNNWIDERKTTWGTTPDIKAKFAYLQDDMGRVTDVTKTYGLFSGYGAGTDKGLKTSYTYNDRSELLTENTKDLAGSPVDITGRQTTYAYDEMGNRESVTKARASGDAGGNLTFDYSPSSYEINSLNQYQRRTVPGIYDVAAISTASSVTVDGGGMVKQGEYFFRGHPLNNSTAPIFDTLTIQPNGGSPQDHPAYLPMTNEDFKYDDDGNLTRDGRWVYEYDAENRLVAMYTRGAPEDPLETESPNVAVWNSCLPRQKLLFTYDYLGRRVEKKVYYWAGTSPGDWAVDDDFKFIYNGWNCIAKLDAGSGNAVVASYYWGLDLSGSQQGAGGVGGLLITQEGGNTYLPAYDAMGNVHAMIKASDGSIAAAYEYDAFGNTLRETGPYAAANPFRFATKYTDIETGLIYHDTRYYSPSLGRFTTRDSISEQGGLNLYAYVSNRVPNAWDYLGRRPSGPGPGDEPMDAGRAYSGGSLGGDFLMSFNNNWGAQDGGGGSKDLVTVIKDLFAPKSPSGIPPGAVPVQNWGGQSGYFVNGADGELGNFVATGPAAGSGNASAGSDSLLVGTVNQMGADLLGGAENGIRLINNNVLRPINNGITIVGDIGAWVGNQALPGSGPGVRNVIIVGSMFVGPGRARLANVAEDAVGISRLAPGGGLIASERAGGHLLAIHVGQTEGQLAARLSAQPSLSAASTFATRAQAEAAVSAAIESNAARVAEWVSGGASGRLPLNAAFSGGTVLQRGSAVATQGNGVRVILQGNAQGGYYVLTGFPTP